MPPIFDLGGIKYYKPLPDVSPLKYERPMDHIAHLSTVGRKKRDKNEPVMKSLFVLLILRRFFIYIPMQNFNPSLWPQSTPRFNI
jgi:hypothetical protein